MEISITKMIGLGLLVLLLLGSCVPGATTLSHMYSRWNADMHVKTMLHTEISRVKEREIEGKKILAEAEWTRKIKVASAKAEREAAIELAGVEIERAKGVAEANKIIGESLKGNEGYLRYLWIQGLQDGKNSTIYIPTEAGLPILEAGRATK